MGDGHVRVLDLDVRPCVGARFAVHHQPVALHTSFRAGRVRAHLDEPAVAHDPAVLGDRLGEDVRGGVRRQVHDLRAGVLVDAFAGDADVEVIGACALAHQEGAGVEHHVLRAHRAADPLHCTSGVDDCALRVQVVDVLRPVLHGRVPRLGALVDEDLDDRGVHRVDAVGLRRAALDVVHLRALVGHYQRVLEGALAGALHAEVGLQGQVDLDALGDIQEGAARPDRSVQRRELVVLRRHAFVHEVLLDQLRVLGDRSVHRAEQDPELRVLLLEALVDGLLAPYADDAGEVLALGLGDAEVFVGLLHLGRNFVPGVEAPGRRRRVEHQLVEVQAAQVGAPGRHRLAFEDFQRLEPFLGHPVGLALDLGQLADDLPRDALARNQLALVVLDDRARFCDAVNCCHWVLAEGRESCAVK